MGLLIYVDDVDAVVAAAIAAGGSWCGRSPISSTAIAPAGSKIPMDIAGTSPLTRKMSRLKRCMPGRGVCCENGGRSQTVAPARVLAPRGAGRHVKSARSVGFRRGGPRLASTGRKCGECPARVAENQPRLASP